MTARSRLALACALALGTLAFTVSPASAGITHKFEKAITAPNPEGTGTLTAGATTVTGVLVTKGDFVPGEEIIAPGFLPAGTAIVTVEPGTLTVSKPAEASSGIPMPITAQGMVHPWGLAFDASGNLLTADAEGEGATAGAIDIFNPSGTFTSKLTDASVGANPFTGPYVRSVAVDNVGPNKGMVYVAESNGENVDVFKPKPGEPGKYELIQERKFHSYVYVAFDNSGGPNSGELYVISNPTHAAFLLKPEAGGTLPLEPLPPEPGEEPLAAPPGGFSLSECCEGGAGGLAVGPTGKLYLANPAAKAVDVYTAEATAPVVLTKGPPGAESFEPIAVGVDPSNGNVYAVDAANHVVDEFSPAGKYLGQITQAEPEKPFVTPLGVAVNASGDVYVSDGGAKVVNVYGPDEEEPLPPVVSGGASTGLTATEATLEAKVNPNGFAIRFETTYRFEYGTSTAYGTSVPVPDGAIGTGTSDVPVTTHLSGLSPNKTYHWRLAATNTNGTTTGPDHTFVYPETGSGTLPDNRAYEMVTPPQKNGALIGEVPLALFPLVSGDGSRVIAGAVQCFGGSVSCVAIRGTVSTPYEFSRTGAGWVTTPLAPPASVFEANTWWKFNPDLGTVLFSATTPPHGEEDFYAREPGGSFRHIGPLSPPEQGQDVNAILPPQGAATADFSHVVFAERPGPYIQGAPRSLLEYVGAGVEPSSVDVSGGQGSHDLIDTVQTKLGGRPDGAGPVTAMSVDGRVIYFTAFPSEHGTEANKTNNVPVDELYARVDNGEEGAHTVAISEPNGLPVSQPDGACSKEPCLKNIGKGDEEAWGNAAFQGASSDGSKVFFTDVQQLTDTATQDPSNPDAKLACSETVGANGCNLYLSECFAQCKTLGEQRRLLDVSVGDTSGGGPRVQGVLAFSSDDSHVYFGAKGVLTGAANSQGQTAQQGQDNLYVYERDEGHPGGRLAFIATLTKADNEGRAAVWGLVKSANVTPDGRFLVFTSSGLLTPDATRTDGARQVFRYDAQTGQLLRVSVGERGFNDNGNAGAGGASIVPATLVAYKWAGAPRLDPTMSDDGSRVFFSSPVALTAGALSSVPIGTNGHNEQEYAGNVYEWEQPGVGSCPASQGSGCVFLISDGRDTSAAEEDMLCPGSTSAVCLLGADRTGSNVFFTTVDRLVSSDTDTQLDIYDARVCEPEHGNPCIQQTSTSPPCLGEACHGIPPATPGEPGGGSATLNAAGNLTSTLTPPAKPTAAQLRAKKLAGALGSCRRRYKHSKKRRASCEKSAHQKYGAAKKSSKKKGK
jgi:hypothetical protein